MAGTGHGIEVKQEPDQDTAGEHFNNPCSSSSYSANSNSAWYNVDNMCGGGSKAQIGFQSQIKEEPDQDHGRLNSDVCQDNRSNEDFSDVFKSKIKEEPDLDTVSDLESDRDKLITSDECKFDDTVTSDDITDDDNDLIPPGDIKHEPVENVEESSLLSNFETASNFSENPSVGLGVEFNGAELKAKKPFSCNQCDKSYVNLQSLKIHMKNHNGERRYHCEVCGKSYARSDYLKIHARVHSGERPYECEVCKMAFKYLSSLHKHRVIHTGERPYDCETCGKAFVCKTSLLHHTRTHTGERPHKCHVCERSFIKKSKLNQHMKVHAIYLNAMDRDNIRDTGVETTNLQGHKGLNSEVCNDDCDNEDPSGDFNSEIDFKSDIKEEPDLDNVSDVESNSGVETANFQGNEWMNSVACQDDCGDEDPSGDFRSEIKEEPDVDNVSDMENYSGVETTNLQGREWMNSEMCQDDCGDEDPSDDFRSEIKEEPDLDTVSDVESNSGKLIASDVGMLDDAMTSDVSDDDDPMLPGKIKHNPAETVDKSSLSSKSEAASNFNENRSAVPSVEDSGPEVKAKKPFSCNQCDKSYVTNQSLRKHMKNHTGERYHCEVCGKSFPRSDYLKIHARVHSGETPYECEVCKVAFKYLSSLHRHKSTHTGEKPHCEICDKSFACKTTLLHHKKTHTGERPHKCNVCERLFIKKSRLNEHMKGHTPYFNAVDRDNTRDTTVETTNLQGRKLFNSEVCQDDGEDEDPSDGLKSKKKEEPDLDTVNDVESNSDKLTTSDVCKLDNNVTGDDVRDDDHDNPNLPGDSKHEPEKLKESSLVDRLEAVSNFSETSSAGPSVKFNGAEHGKSRTEKKAFSCNQCDKSYAKKHSLKMHMRNHTGERPYDCEVCGKSYSNKQYLKIHARIHSGERPYECEVCKLAFKYMSSLFKHRMIHTGEKPHECETCGKAFVCKTTLLYHTRTHTGEKPHQCNVCGHSFIKKSKLNQHMKVHTK